MEVRKEGRGRPTDTSTVCCVCESSLRVLSLDVTEEMSSYSSLLLTQDAHHSFTSCLFLPLLLYQYLTSTGHRTPRLSDGPVNHHRVCFFLWMSLRRCLHTLHSYSPRMRIISSYLGFSSSSSSVQDLQVLDL